MGEMSDWIDVFHDAAKSGGEVSDGVYKANLRTVHEACCEHKAEATKQRQDAEMSWGCIEEVREVLEHFGKDMQPPETGEGTPPMFYREWLLTLLARFKEDKEKAEAEVERLKDQLDEARKLAGEAAEQCRPYFCDDLHPETEACPDCAMYYKLRDFAGKEESDEG